MGVQRTFFGDGEGKFRIHSYFQTVIYDVLTIKVFQPVKCFVTFAEFLGGFSTFLLNILLNRHYSYSVSVDWYILTFSLNLSNSFYYYNFLLIHLALFFFFTDEFKYTSSWQDDLKTSCEGGHCRFKNKLKKKNSNTGLNALLLG